MYICVSYILIYIIHRNQAQVAQVKKPVNLNVIQHEPVTAERILAAGLEIIEGEAEEGIHIY
jgi:hypothetical protein